MLHKTQGIVLSTFPYSDTYSVTQLYTRDFGRVSYLLPKARGRKTKFSPSLFFPLTVLYLEVEHMPLRDLQRIKEATRQFPLYDVNTHMTKISLAFFLSEFLSRLLQESDHNGLLFDYLKNSVETLEAADRGVANFHLAFMLGLTRFLGIRPNMDDPGKNSYFDLLNGEFTRHMPLHSHYLNREQSAFLLQLHRMHYGNMHLFRLSRSQRNMIVDYLLEYYRLHICDFPPLKSLKILRGLA
ncbi:MAG: DNA repair protein RecO [Proteiniphilum sp.]|nr:DNA repair protein RecO [Proteiniphilum sp.]MDD4800701.1 DNA repair protein RecO [Proteiniphilum sp.]